MAYTPVKVMEIQAKGPGDRMLEMIRQRHPEYHPVLAMADLAHSTDNEELEFKCHQAIAKYVAPELKSIEVRAEINEQRRVIVEMFDEAVIKHDVPLPLAEIDRSLEDSMAVGISGADALKAAIRLSLDEDLSHGS